MQNDEYLEAYQTSLKKPEGAFFEEAKSRFVKDFAYGGAIRHLADKGYTADRIIEEFHYPLSRESIEGIIREYTEGK